MKRATNVPSHKSRSEAFLGFSFKRFWYSFSHVPRKLLTAGLALIFLAAAACRPKSETERILEAVDDLARLAEKKDIEAFMASVEEEYSDFEGRDKAGLKNLLGGYFAGRTGIVVHRLGGRVAFPEPGRAALQADVALSSGAAEALRRLVRLAPDLYRLQVEFARPADRWLVHHAEWQAIGLAEVFPESLDIFKSLFPNQRTE
jgi:hypothetical protein